MSELELGLESGLLGSLADRILLGLCPSKARPEAADSKLITLDDLFIRTKDRQLVRFAPNQVQAKYLDQILPGWHLGQIKPRGLREMILKARQFGFSTLIEAIYFIDTINHPNTTTVVISQDADSTRKLFRMVKTFYDQLPPYKQPRTSTKNKGEFFFPELNSTYYIGTAGDRSFGRGDTISNLHASEVAFYVDADTLMTGLLQAVPQESGNVIIETTANGLGNWYHQEFVLAERGDSTFEPRFFAWFEHPEYTWDPKSDAEKALSERLESKLVAQDFEKEEALKTTYSLMFGQILWRRRKMSEPGMRKKMVQEYPSNPKEAFIASGNPYFDRDKLDLLHLELEARGDRTIEFAIPAEYPNLRRAYRNGELKIWQSPLPGRTYTIGADTAEGLNQSGDHDFSPADVLDDVTGEQVATLHCQEDTHTFGLMLAELGWLYNTALVAPEANNHGHAVMNAMLHSAGYPEATDEDPRGLYLHQNYDEHKRDEMRKPGWPSNLKYKPIALSSLDQAVDESDVIINDIETIGEMMTYVKLPGGKSGGEGASHDDRVISIAIAVAVWRAKPMPVSYAAYAGGRQVEWNER